MQALRINHCITQIHTWNIHHALYSVYSWSCYSVFNGLWWRLHFTMLTTNWQHRTVVSCLTRLHCLGHSLFQTFRLMQHYVSFSDHAMHWAIFHYPSSVWLQNKTHVFIERWWIYTFWGKIINKSALFQNLRNVQGSHYWYVS